mmetsp:Transcript_16192/g.56560  ORF Transcript_16192/g.56560 Transcript_16192/m.56560 type:complete len:201 (+) Transcript_16192:521-1123(+)
MLGRACCNRSVGSLAVSPQRLPHDKDGRGRLVLRACVRQMPVRPRARHVGEGVQLGARVHECLFGLPAGVAKLRACLPHETRGPHLPLPGGALADFRTCLRCRGAAGQVFDPLSRDAPCDPHFWRRRRDRRRPHVAALVGEGRGLRRRDPVLRGLLGGERVALAELAGGGSVGVRLLHGAWCREGLFHDRELQGLAEDPC